MIPIFYKNELRKKITFLQLKYLLYIFNELKKKNILISLTVVGQPEYHSDIQKYLSFNKDNIFVIFNQNNYNINYNLNFYHNNNLKKMLHNKIKKGLEISFKKEKDYSCFMGSNDFIHIDWFLSLKNNYILDEKQIIGIHKTTNNLKNYTFLYKLDEKIKIKNLKEVGIWDGNHKDELYKKYNNFSYFGAIIGFNKLSYNDILNINNLWHEIQIESNCIKNNYKNIKNNNCLYLNIKSGQDLTDSDKLFSIFKIKIIDEKIINKKNDLLKLLDELY